MNSKTLVYLSLILALVAAVHMSFWGASYTKVSAETGEAIESGRTRAFHPILIVFVVFPLVGLWGIQKENLRVLRGAAIGMFLLVFLSFFGAGAVFLPSVFLLIIAALLFRRKTERATK